MRQEDIKWMSLALREAEKAALLQEVPIGAVLVGSDGSCLAKAHNLREKLKSPLAHAELLALHRAAKKLNSWRLTGSTLYVTLEPCPMCIGALLQARVKRLIFGALDPKAGAVQSLYQLAEDPRLNHQIEVESGVLQENCSAVLTNFFKELRQRKKV